VTILDFGLAKAPASEATGTVSMTMEGTVLGTVGYMSPEQLLGQAVDQRTDIFGVGVMLAETLTGRRPFEGDTFADVSRAVLNQAYRLPATSPSLVAIDATLQRCLAKDPSERVASAESVREVLIPALRRLA
jgi:serine/threonine protein kinase